MQVFLFCFLGATLLWFVNSLNKQHTETISFPLILDYDKTKYIPVEPLPKALVLNVKGNGWQIMKAYFNFKITPVKYTIRQPGGLGSKSYILTSGLRRQILSSLEELKLEHIWTDTLYYSLDLKKEKDILLTVDSSDIRLAEGYQLSTPLSISHHKIRVSGPKKIIEKLPYLFKISLGKSGIKQDFKQQVPILFNHVNNDLLTINHPSILVSFGVAPFISRTHKFIIHPENFPKKSKFSLHKERRQVELTYAVRKEDAGKVRLTDFRIIADYKTFNPKDSTVALKISKRPAIIKEENIRIPLKIKLDYNE